MLYWLAVLKGKAHTLAEDTVVNTDTIPAGYLVVKAQWLRLEQRECEGKLRSYTLLEAETLIIVNHMVRLAGLRFSPGPGGPADRQLRSAREKLYYMAYRRITRSRRAAVKTSLIDIVWRCRFVQKCVLESARWQNFLRLRRGRSPRG